MIPAAAGIGLGIQGIAGLIGELIAAGDEQKARDLLQQSMDELGNIDLPKLEQLAAEQLGPSALGGVEYDSAARQAELESLGALDEVISGGGLAAADRANINAISGQVNRRARAGREAITQGMAARGAGGGGQETAALLAANQDSSERLAGEGQETMAEAVRNRFRALAQKGSQAGAMGSAKFARDARKAEAADTINRINADYRTAAKRYNATLPQQNFANQMGLANAKADVRGAQAGTYSAGAANTRQLAAGLGAAGAQGAYGIGQWLEEEEKKKNGGQP